MPLGGHLALTGDPSEMRITWTTANYSQPQVKYGIWSGVYDAVALATTSTYTREQLCGEPATTIGWRDPGSLHTAVMTNLLPGLQCYFSLHDMCILLNSFLLWQILAITMSLEIHTMDGVVNISSILLRV